MKKKILIFCLIIALFGGSLVLVFSNVKNDVKAAGLPFGGQIVRTIICTCSPGVYKLIYKSVAGVSPLAYVTGGSILYSQYNFMTPGVWHLGTYTPGGQPCWQYHGHHCRPDFVAGVISQVGTSAN